MAAGWAMHRIPSPEGHVYRGRGDLQLTGKDNYARFGKLLDVDLVGSPELAAGEIGTLIALQFFKLGNVNAAVDADDFTRARRIINGGTIGLDEVARIRERLLAVLV
jgi:putative chitinase